MTTRAMSPEEEFSFQTATNVQQLMADKGVTMEELVARLNLTPTQVESLNTGHDLGVTTLHRVAGALGVQGADLFPGAFPWSSPE
jgi:DNA-binding Xre family transcriptional regulator